LQLPWNNAIEISIPWITLGRVDFAQPIFIGNQALRAWSARLRLGCGLQKLLSRGFAAASTLSNGTRLPVFLIMDCLNGFFHDVYTESLAESLMLAKNGLAAEQNRQLVFAPTGKLQPQPQNLFF
jgi:hypothetical protein